MRDMEPMLVDYLTSLKDWCEKVASIVASMSHDEFKASQINQLALSMAIAQIGEISGRIHKKWPQFSEENPRLSLSHASAMRNRIIHGYDQVDQFVLWETAVVSVSDMLKQLHSMLSSDEKL